MTPRLDLAPRRTRESTSKVRTGCSTCKARRVKCDEAKPICRRCAVGGRNCMYNATNAIPPRRNVITIYLPPTQSQPTLFANDRGLDFFHQNLASKLDGQFDSKFWSRLVLQLSHSESSIRHAVLAISIIYQDVESSLQHPAGYVNSNPEGQREWNTAIKSLSTRIQVRPNSHLVSLVCCLLFTCIEFLKGNIESSLLHVQSGFNILAAIRHNSDSGFAISSHDLQAVEDHVVPIFSSLNVLCSLAARMMPPMYAPAAEEDSPHQNFTDSRRRLIGLSDTCIRFIHDASIKAAMFQIDFNDLVDQFKLQARLDAWRDQLNDLVERKRTAGSHDNQDALNLLLVHYKVTYIWLRVCTIAGEMAADSYHKDFEELVHYAEQFTKSGAERATPQPLSFDIQILGPLYYAALKCRHPTIRRRALELLKLAPRREGLWNGHHAYVTAKRLIEVEERHLNGQNLPDETSRVHGLPLPDDQSRIYNPGEVPFDFRKFDHSVVPSPACPGTLEAVFQTKPWGLLGEWQTTTEYIKL